MLQTRWVVWNHVENRCEYVEGVLEMLIGCIEKGMLIRSNGRVLMVFSGVVEVANGGVVGTIAMIGACEFEWNTNVETLGLIKVVCKRFIGSWSHSKGVAGQCIDALLP